MTRRSFIGLATAASLAANARGQMQIANGILRSASFAPDTPSLTVFDALNPGSNRNLNGWVPSVVSNGSAWFVSQGTPTLVAASTGILCQDAVSEAQFDLKTPNGVLSLTPIYSCGNYTGNFVDLVIRSQDANNKILIRAGNPSGSDLFAIISVASGVETVLASDTSAIDYCNVPPGILVQFEGASLTAFLGQKTLSASSGLYLTNTVCGFVTRVSVATVKLFDFQFWAA